MQDTLQTPRLHLTRLTSAPRGSPEFARLHELWTNEGAQRWSIAGVSKDEETTEAGIQKFLPDSSEKRHNIAYVVHERDADSTRFVGLVTLIPAHKTLPIEPPLVPAADPRKFVIELGYLFLPVAWGRGLATEAVGAVVAAARGAGKGFWEPWESVWVRVIVNGRNPASERVMEKVGLRRMGVYVWEGEKLWIGGEWATRDELVIFGGEVL